MGDHKSKLESDVGHGGSRCPVQSINRDNPAQPGFDIVKLGRLDKIILLAVYCDAFLFQQLSSDT